jgi:hypothetical protein
VQNRRARRTRSRPDVRVDEEPGGSPDAAQVLGPLELEDPGRLQDVQARREDPAAAAASAPFAPGRLEDDDEGDEEPTVRYRCQTSMTTGLFLIHTAHSVDRAK